MNKCDNKVTILKSQANLLHEMFYFQQHYNCSNLGSQIFFCIQQYRLIALNGFYMIYDICQSIRALSRNFPFPLEKPAKNRSVSTAWMLVYKVIREIRGVSENFLDVLTSQLAREMVTGSTVDTIHLVDCYVNVLMDGKSKSFCLLQKHL